MKLLHALTGCLALTLTLPAFAANVSCAELSEESLESVMQALPPAELRAFADNCRQEAKDLGKQADLATDPQEKQALEKAHDQATDNGAVASYVAATKKN